ncbi:MAG: hypothetical protein AABX53_00160 [Nanoarchaeota archaeon]
MDLLRISLSAFVLFVFVGLFFFLTEERSFAYSLTKAICEGNTCRDYEIICAGRGEVVSMTPLTGFVTFPSDWKDTRVKKELCVP